MICTFSVVNNVLYLVRDELRTICELDEDTMVRFKDCITFYFAQKDKWVPDTFPERLRVLIPEADIQIDSVGCDHAFVLQHSSSMASVMGPLLHKHAQHI
jgi:hypothetical protein